MERASLISLQRAHSLQGVGVGPRSQLRALARMRAALVLPTPRTPGEQVAVGDAAALDGVGEDAGDVLLPHHVRETLRPPFAGQNEIRHDESRLQGGMLIADSQASPWHRGGPLPLLPSGPDGVCGTHLHGTRLPAINIPAADPVAATGTCVYQISRSTTSKSATGDPLNKCRERSGISPAPDTPPTCPRRISPRSVCRHRVDGT